MKTIFIFIILLLSSIKVYSQDILSTNYNSNEDTTLIILNTTIDGNDYRFLFDSGAQLCVIFNDGDIDLSKVRKVNAIDVHENKTEVSIIKKKIEIKTLKIKHKGYCLIMDNKPDFMKELNIQGILGANIINQYDWKIDFAKLEIHRLKKVDISTNQFFELNTFFDKRTQLLSTNIINKKDTSNYTIDTGANLIIAGYKDELDENNIKLKRYAYTFTISSNLLNDSSLIGVENITIGNFVIQDIPFMYNNNPQTNNTLGLMFFKPFKEIYILNTKNKIFVKKIEYFQYSFDNYIVKNNIVVSQYIPFNFESISYIGKNINDLKDVEFKKNTMPITKYSNTK